MTRLHVYDFCDTIVREQTHDDFIWCYLLHFRRWLRVGWYLLLKNPITLVAFKLFATSPKVWVTQLLRGEPIADVQEFARQYVIRLRRLENPQILELLCRPEPEIEKVVVSAGLSLCIHAYIESLHLEFPVQVIANDLAIEGSVVSGVFSRQDCFGAEKVARLLEHFPTARIERSFSDSLSDLPLFRISEQPFLVDRSGSAKRLETTA